MTLSPKLLKQLGRPSGFAGRIILRMLNRVNRGINDCALAALNLRENAHVLEIGFGGGSLIARILAKDMTTRITGAEVSRLAIQTAQKRFRKEPRVDFKQCDGDTLPFGNAVFTRAVSVNVIYFWPNVPEMLSEVYRVLANDGKFVLCYSEDSPDNITRFNHKDVEAQLQTAGFATVHSTQILDKENDAYYCTVAIKVALNPAE